MSWKVLFSEYLIKRPWLTARRDKVELPDGLQSILARRVNTACPRGQTRAAFPNAETGKFLCLLKGCSTRESLGTGSLQNPFLRYSAKCRNKNRPNAGIKIGQMPEFDFFFVSLHPIKIR